MAAKLGPLKLSMLPELPKERDLDMGHVGLGLRLHPPTEVERERDSGVYRVSTTFQHDLARRGEQY